MSSGLFHPGEALYDELAGTAHKVKNAPQIPFHLAAAGLGPVARVSAAPCIWRCCVPDDLLPRYRHFAHTQLRTPSHRSHKPPARDLHAVFCSIHKITEGVRRTLEHPTASAFLRPKPAEKCRCLPNATALNVCDARTPPHIHLPALVFIYKSFSVALAGAHIYVCKLDLKNR